MQRFAIAAVVGLLALAPSPVRANGRVSVFDLEAGPGADRLAAATTEHLRKAVAGASGLQSVPGKSLAEIKLVFGCPDTPVKALHKCIAKAAESLKADWVVLGKVSAAGGGEFKVVLTLLPVSNPLRPKTISERISVVKTAGDALARQAGAWIDQLFGRKAMGTVEVRCPVNGVTVSVAGQDSGTCGQQPRQLTLPVGSHELEFRKAGHQAARLTVKVVAGETTRVTPSLPEVVVARRRVVPPDDRTPPTARRTPPDEAVTPPRGDDGTRKDGRVGWKVAFFGTAAAGVGVLVGSIITGLRVRSLEADKEDAIRRSWSGPNPVTNTTDACTHNGGNLEVVDICNRGVNAARTTNVLIGVGAGLVALSTVFLWKAYLSKGKSERPRETTIRVLPEWWGKGGGVSAAFEF